MVDEMAMATQTQTIPVRSAQERRRSERKPHVVETFISSPTSTKPEDREEVTGVNLSRHGVAFEASRPFPTDTFHIIDFAMGDQRMYSEIRIVSCRPAGNGRSEIGAEFC
jgi:hypothetical protein